MTCKPRFATDVFSGLARILVYVMHRNEENEIAVTNSQTIDKLKSSIASFETKHKELFMKLKRTMIVVDLANKKRVNLERLLDKHKQVVKDHQIAITITDLVHNPSLSHSATSSTSAATAPMHSSSNWSDSKCIERCVLTL